MLNMNRATLVGHAGRDPEIRALNNGGKAAVFTLATTEKWKDREGAAAENTEWHRIVVYGPVAEAVEKMLRKGDAVLVEGRIATRAFRDKDGHDARRHRNRRRRLAGHGQHPVRPACEPGSRLGGRDRWQSGCPALAPRGNGPRMRYARPG